MTKQETLEYNKRCAEFLGMHISVDPADGYDTGTWYKPSDIEGEVIPSPVLFHSDWNWIMEVVDAIEKVADWTLECLNYSNDNRDYQMMIPLSHTNVIFKDRKEAVVQAINQFLIWYEQNK